jgi:hypothetical protein
MTALANTNTVINFLITSSLSNRKTIRAAIYLGNVNLGARAAGTKNEKSKTKSRSCFVCHKPQPAFNAKQANQTESYTLRKKLREWYNDRMLGVGFPRYAVGVCAPSVWGGLL